MDHSGHSSKYDFVHHSREPIVTAKKFLEYKKLNGHMGDFVPPKIVLVCYQQSTLNHLINKYNDLQSCPNISGLYFICDGDVGVLGGWGIGAPALALKLEELISLGVKKFVSIGTAGTLMHRHTVGDLVIASKALAEDGVAHHYLTNGTEFADADPLLIHEWRAFAASEGFSKFDLCPAWSFSAIFKESPADILRVSRKGCGVVEMEAATLYAIAKEKECRALSIFVVSDSISLEEWVPHLKEPIVRENLHLLAESVLRFCYAQATK